MSGKRCYVVSYDIMEQKRLYKVHRAMMGFGEPVHYSVFRCDLTPRGRAEMVTALTDLIKPDEDRIMIIDLGQDDGSFEKRVEFIGVHKEETDRTAIII